MTITTHLKSLQALEMALREGSLKAAAQRLSITPAAVGQRIRALESFLGTDLLMRGRSGLSATAVLERATIDLRVAFEALDRVTQSLDFQRTTEIHIVADPDWSELWLMPRLVLFRAENPNILFCINGTGDVPVRIGAPDCRIEYVNDSAAEVLYTDILLPVASPDNIRRFADQDSAMPMEGMPLLHLQSQRDSPDRPGWVDWFKIYGQRQIGGERGIHYRQAGLAIEAVRENVGFLLGGLSLVQEDLQAGRIILPFPQASHIIAPCPYSMTLRDAGLARPQMRKFVDWLRREARITAERIQSAIES